MKIRKKWFSKILVILLCFMLVLSSTGFNVFADDGDLCTDGHSYVDGVCEVCGTQESVDETENETVSEEPGDEEQPQDEEPVEGEILVEEPQKEEAVVDEKQPQEAVRGGETDPTYRIYFDANGGSGEMEFVDVPQDSTYTLPDCEFDPPAGLCFVGWMDYDQFLGMPDDEITVSYDLYLTPRWGNEWDYLQVRINAAADDGNPVELDKDYIADASNAPLYISDNVELDLCGYSLTANLSMSSAIELREGVLTSSAPGGTVNGGVALFGDSDSVTLSGSLTIDHIYLLDSNTINTTSFQPDSPVTVTYVDTDYSEYNAYIDKHDQYVANIEAGMQETDFLNEFIFTNGGGTLNSTYFVPENPDYYYMKEITVEIDGEYVQELALCPKMMVEYAGDLRYALTPELAFVKPGDLISLTADSGALLYGLYIYYNDNSIGAEIEVTVSENNGTYTFIMPKHDISIDAMGCETMTGYHRIWIEPAWYNGGGIIRSARSSNEQGEIIWAYPEVNGVTSYYARAQDEVTLNFVCKEGFKLTGFMLDCDDGNICSWGINSTGAYYMIEDQYTFTMPDSDVCGSMTGDKAHDIIVSAENGSFITKQIYDDAGGAPKYLDVDYLFEHAQQNDIYIYAVPDDGYYFELGSIDTEFDDRGEYVSDCELFTVDENAGAYRLVTHYVAGDLILSGRFVSAETSYELSINSSESFTSELQVNGQTVTEAHPGDTVEVCLTPDEGYEITSIYASTTTQFGDNPMLLDFEGDNTWSFTMPASDVTIFANAGQPSIVTSWMDLKEALEIGGSITLGDDISWTSSDGTDSYLNVALGTIATLDMNGHTLDMGTSYLESYGNLVINGGTIINGYIGANDIANVTINNSTIIAGPVNSSIAFAAGNAELTLNNCSITLSQMYSRSVSVLDEAQLTLEGCTFGDGIYVFTATSSTLILKGKNNISEIALEFTFNTLSNSIITIDDSFMVPDSPISINADYVSWYSVITNGWDEWKAGHPNVSIEDCFVPLNSYHVLVEEDDGEIYYGVHCRIEFAANGAEGTMDDGIGIIGVPYTLPESGFTPPTGKKFRHWLIDNKVYAVGDAVIPDTDLYAEAIWKDKVTLATFALDTNSQAVAGNITISTYGELYQGDEVTVTAPNVLGYVFQGWFNGSDFVCATKNYSFRIEENTTLIARYEARGNAVVTVNTVNKAEYWFGSADDTSQPIQDGTSSIEMPLGSTLTITAYDENKVLQWQNESGKIIGTGPYHTITVTGNMTVTLVYKSVRANQAYLQFVSDYGQVLTFQQINQNSQINFPVPPSKYGYLFNTWVYEGTVEEATADGIKGKIGAADTIITVKPTYSSNNMSGTVTVEHHYGSTVDVEQTESYAIGSNHTFSARTYPGYKFKWWKINDVVVSDLEDFFMKVSGNITLKAYYVPEDETVIPEPRITIGELFTVEDIVDGVIVHKVSGQVTRSIPDGYILLEHGVLGVKNPTYTLTVDNFVYDGEEVHPSISNATSLSGVMTLNAKVGNDDMEVWMRGYMLLEDVSTGKQEYYYTDIKHGSYNSINSNNQ